MLSSELSKVVWYSVYLLWCGLFVYRAKSSRASCRVALIGSRISWSSRDVMLLCDCVATVLSSSFRLLSSLDAVVSKVLESVLIALSACSI